MAGNGANASPSVGGSVDPYGPCRTEVTTETRVATTDPRSGRHFAAYWLVVGPLSALIRRLALRRTATQVEHHGRLPSPPLRCGHRWMTTRVRGRNRYEQEGITLLGKASLV